MRIPLARRKGPANQHCAAPSKNMTNREFSFTLQNDVYLRYKSFSTADELKKDVVLHNPSRFEIGPVYSARVRRYECLGGNGS